MNAIQQAISKVTGFEAIHDDLNQQIGALENANVLLQHQIEDLDYLNLFDLNNILEAIPGLDRKKTIGRLRALRHQNPLAKQSVNLVKRFTLGKGVQYVITPDPATTPEGDDANPAVTTAGGAAPPEGGSTGGGVRLDVRASEALPYTNGSTPKPPPVPGEVDTGNELLINDTQDADEIRKVFDAFWTDEDNKLAFTDPESMKEWFDQIITDGETFFLCTVAQVEPHIKVTDLPVEEFETIIYDPDNKKRPVYYKRVFQELEYDGNQYKNKGNPQTKYYLDYRITDERLAEIGSRIKIKKGEQTPPDQRILHALINPVWTKKGRRGISELYASREWFRVFKEFIEDRAAINAAATSIAFRRKVKGGPSAVAAMGGKFGGKDVGWDAEGHPATGDVRKLTRPVPGAIYDSNPAVDLDWMKTDTGAVNAKEDARAILMAAGAGVGINIHYFGEGGDANLATAQAMELPMVKSFEDWQNWVNSVLLQFTYYLLRVATDLETARKHIGRFAFSFPPIISQDVVKWVTAWTQVVSQVAPGNAAVQEQAIRAVLTILGVSNIDGLMPKILADAQKAETERLAQNQAMMDSLNRGGAPGDEEDDEKPNPVQTGDGNALDPQLKTIARGKIPPKRNGPKVPR